MNETPFFFPSAEHRIFGVLHRPQAPNGSGFVLCHPFAEEKLWAHRVFASYARVLCSAGYAVLRFDYAGHGDSSGRFEDSTVDSRLNDIACAVTTLRTSCGLEAVGLLGLRFGATLSALAAENDSSIGPLILWEPVYDGAQYMKELIRVNLVTQTAVYKQIRHNTEALVARLKESRAINIDGYDIRWPLYEQVSSIRLSGRRFSYGGNVLLVQIDKAMRPELKRVEPIARGYAHATFSGVVEQPFWREIKEYYADAPQLFDVTTKWIGHHEP